VDARASRRWQMSIRNAQESKTNRRPIGVARFSLDLSRNGTSKLMEFGQQEFSGEVQ
jgi:hypothetical protein